LGLSVAIIGAGPAGFYTAEALLDRSEDVAIDIIERLPTPYGLVRAGVAPDHQSTKQVARKFEQTVLENLVHFYGNVAVGRDIALDDLRRLYDAVVLATGSPSDRTLGIPGEQLPGVYGATAFVGWYNGHPDFRSLDPRLAPTAVVIGNGNVALDVARILVRSRAEMAASDIPEPVMAAIEAAQVQRVDIVGRRGPREVKFAPAELREVSRLADAVPLVAAADLPGAGGAGEDKVQTQLRAFAAHTPAAKPKQIRFRFFLSPVEVIGDATAITGLRCERTRLDGDRAVGTGSFETIGAGLVVSAIGYRASPIPGVPFDAERGLIMNDDGRVGPGLYTVGWAKRGPTGVIGSNKPDGARCATQILADLGAASQKPGRLGLERLLHRREVRFVTFADWQAIDEAEVAAAAPPAPRRKFTSLGDMLAVVGKSEAKRVSGRG
jgi:ferredoxin--NADP+ reductase